MNEALQKQLSEDICGGSEVTVAVHTPSREIHDTVSAPFNLGDKKTDERDGRRAKRNTEREEGDSRWERMMLNHKH